MVGSTIASNRVVFAAAGCQTVAFISVELAITCLFLWLINSISFMCLVRYFMCVLLVWPVPRQTSGGLIKCPREAIRVQGMSMTECPLYTRWAEVAVCFNICARSVCPAVGTVVNAVNAA